MHDLDEPHAIAARDEPAQPEDVDTILRGFEVRRDGLRPPGLPPLRDEHIDEIPVVPAPREVTTLSLPRAWRPRLASAAMATTGACALLATCLLHGAGDRTSRPHDAPATSADVLPVVTGARAAAPARAVDPQSTIAASRAADPVAPATGTPSITVSAPKLVAPSAAPVKHRARSSAMPGDDIVSALPE